MPGSSNLEVSSRWIVTCKAECCGWRDAVPHIAHPIWMHRTTRKVLIITSQCMRRRGNSFQSNGQVLQRLSAKKVSNGGVRLIWRYACCRSQRLGGLMDLIDSDNKICILRRATKALVSGIHLDRRTRAAAELLAAWTCVAQTHTQEGAERAKDRRRKIQGCAGTQSICAPAGAPFSDDTQISRSLRCRPVQVVSKSEEART